MFKAKVYKKVIFTFLLIQKFMLWVSYGLFCNVKPDKGLWVVGVDEIANVISHMTPTFDKSYSVNFSNNRFYQTSKYDFDIRNFKVNARLIRFFIGPVLLGYLARRADGFFYIWNTGFLVHSHDGREYEFSFLKKHNKKIATFFVGSDIRSPVLSLEYAKEHDMDVPMTYLLFRNNYNVDKQEKLVKLIANSADRHADYIFNIPVDQRSYLQRSTHFCLLAYPDEGFIKNDQKFENYDRIKILHAPSSPFVKGTPLVRAAIKKLKLMGYDFEYIEIMESDNSIVLRHLKDSHIVLNEFYAFVPGMFGLEAMASHCALLTSADRKIEQGLMPGAEEAWLSTPYWEIFDNLKLLLDDKSLIKGYADRGYDWAYRYCSTSSVRKEMRSIFGLGLVTK